MLGESDRCGLLLHLNRCPWLLPRAPLLPQELHILPLLRLVGFFEPLCQNCIRLRGQARSWRWHKWLDGLNARSLLRQAALCPYFDLLPHS
jgi:hypothetical protein